MKPFQFRREFSPGRRDAKVDQARATLRTLPHLRNMTALAVECQWNLKPETAERVLGEEVARREGRNG